MELTKKILNISASVSIVLLSLSVFIYSIKDSKAIAAPQVDKEVYVPVGLFTKIYGGNTEQAIIGYNAKNGDMKVLAHKDIKNSN